MAAKTFREWYAFFGGEEMAVSRDEAEVVWKAAIKSLEGVQTQTTNIARNEINALIIEIYGVVPAERSYSREEVINYLQRALTSPIA